MKNKLTILAALTVLFVFVLGCSISEQVQRAIGGSDNSSANSNKTLTDKAVDTAVGEEKLGIPECDRLFDELTAAANSPEDDIVTKAAKQYALNKIRESIRQSVQENKGNPQQMAKDCKELKTQLDKFRSEEQTNKQK